MKSQVEFEKTLRDVSDICGLEYENLGGWNYGWHLQINDKCEIYFGFANGPLGYTFLRTDGEMLEGKDMEDENASAKDMAVFIQESLDRCRLFARHLK